MRLLAPAKINLHLRVAPVNADGFHPLQSWMCTVGLFDTLTIGNAAIATEPAGLPITPGQSVLAPPRLPRHSTPLSLTCDDPSLACDESNLVVRAARALLESNNRTAREAGPARDRASADRGRASDTSSPVDSPLQIFLQKQIPTGGGLGGGSSDAASTLLGLNRFWNLQRSPDELATIAATLGSDVAFFCHGPSSICTGRGEIVRPIAPPTPKNVLLILPSLAVPTGPVYRRFDELLTADDRNELTAAVANEPDWDEWTKLSAEALLSLLVNNLERPAFDLHPALGKCHADIEQFLGRTVRMSGSGSSLFTLFDDQIHAERAALTLNGATRPDGISLRVLAVPLAPQIDDDL